MNDNLHPDIEAALTNARSGLAVADWLNDSPEELRAKYDAARVPERLPNPPPHEVEIPSEEGPRRALLFGEPDKRAIVYLHGGGWIVGSPWTHAPITAALAEEAGCAVLSLDYRLAPEHFAPAPIADVHDALRWLAAQGVERVALAGDSAGAAIGLAAEKAWAESTPEIAACVSFYGAFCLRDSASLRVHGTAESGLDRASVARMYDAAQGKAPANPYEAEAVAAGKAPVWLLIAGLDALRDDSLCFTALARRAGRSVEVTVQDGATHGYLQFVGKAGVADRAIRAAGAWIEDRLQATPDASL